MTAQFHGHTHDDWFIVYHNDTGHPSTTAFVAPSGTSYTNRNPEFRIYSVVVNEVKEISDSIENRYSCPMSFKIVI